MWLQGWRTTSNRTRRHSLCQCRKCEGLSSHCDLSRTLHWKIFWQKNFETSYGSRNTFVEKHGRGLSPYLPRHRTTPLVSVVFRRYVFIQNKSSETASVRQTPLHLRCTNWWRDQKRTQQKMWVAVSYSWQNGDRQFDQHPQPVLHGTTTV